MIYRPAIDTQVPVQARPVFHNTEQMRGIMSRLDDMEDHLETLRTRKDSYHGCIYRVPFTPESRALCMEIEALEKQWNGLARQNNPEYYQFWESYWKNWSRHKREYRDAYAAKLRITAMPTISNYCRYHDELELVSYKLIGIIGDMNYYVGKLQNDEAGTNLELPFKLHKDKAPTVEDILNYWMIHAAMWPIYANDNDNELETSLGDFRDAYRCYSGLLDLLDSQEELEYLINEVEPL